MKMALGGCNASRFSVRDILNLREGGCGDRPGFGARTSSILREGSCAERPCSPAASRHSGKLC